MRQSPQPEAQAHQSNGTARSSDLAAELLRDVHRLGSLEVALARREVKDLVVANAIAAGMVGFGGLLVVLGVLVAIPLVLVVLLPWHWLAAAVWAAVDVTFGIGLVLLGKSRVAVKLPARTLESLKENKEWAFRRMKSTVR